MKALLTALLALALLPSAASALPGDPPIVPRSPADGAVVPADPRGVAVGFDCPDYTIAEYSGGGITVTDSGDYEDYDVRFSDRPELGPDGQLASKPYGSDAGPSSSGDGACTALLQTGGGAASPEIVGGTVYWQASRYCNGCGGNQRELGPVRSFEIQPPDVQAKLKAPKHPYGGYLNVYTLKTKASLSGAKVKLQRRAGKRWRTLDTEGFVTDGTKLVAKLPAGRQRVRARVVTPTRSFNAAARKVKVRSAKAKRTTSGRDDGRYKDPKAPKAKLKFKVTGRGAKLRGFDASVTTFCFGPTPETNRIYIGFAKLNTVRVAPDGAVTGVLRTKRDGRILLTGRLHKRRLKGQVELSFSTCNGVRKFSAVRR